MKSLKRNGKLKILMIAAVSLVLLLGMTGIVCLAYFLGVPKCVGEKKYTFRETEIHVAYEDIDIYGKALIPEGTEEKYPLVIYAHGAESDYRADYTTLRSLAMSGIAVYTFDFYGWSRRTTGPEKGDWFKGTARGVDDAYEKQVLYQAEQLDAVIEKCRTFAFADPNRIYLLGSSMGGATVAACSVTHSADIRAIILQYPAINLVPEATADGAALDVNRFTGDVLILQGSRDVIVPQEMSEALLAHYNRYRTDHAEMIVFDGQPHVFTGKYKVQAAREIYRFIAEEHT